MRRVYLDACVVIYYVERHPLLFPAVASALFPAAVESPTPVFSDLTRLECRVHPLRENDQAMLARYDSLFGLPDCELVPLDRDVFDLATDLRARYRLKTPDALHLAAALHRGCDEIWTSDTRLAASAAGRLDVIVFDLPA